MYEKSDFLKKKKHITCYIAPHKHNHAKKKKKAVNHAFNISNVYPRQK